MIGQSSAVYAVIYVLNGCGDEEECFHRHQHLHTEAKLSEREHLVSEHQFQSI